MTRHGFNAKKYNSLNCNFFLGCIDELEAMADLRTKPMFKKV